MSDSESGGLDERRRHGDRQLALPKYRGSAANKWAISQQSVLNSCSPPTVVATQDSRYDIKTNSKTSRLHHAFKVHVSMINKI